MADAFEALLQAQRANSNGAGSESSAQIPILEGLIFKSPKKGVLEMWSREGGIMSATTDAAGLFRETSWSKAIQNGFKNVSAPSIG